MLKKNVNNNFNKKHICIENKHDIYYKKRDLNINSTINDNNLPQKTLILKENTQNSHDNTLNKKNKMIYMKELPESIKDRIVGKIYLYKERKVKWTGTQIESRICEFEDCKLRSNFNFSGEKYGIYCSDHKKENMIDVKSKKCIVCNKKRPNFNFEEQKNPTHCKNCKLENMVDITHKKCIVCNKKTPNFNFIEQKNPTHCTDCKLENMVDVINKKCIVCQIKEPSFNFEGEKKRTHCKNCKLEGFNC